MGDFLACQAAILIDMKKCRIRIHKTTLKNMGKPDYIQLLVNPTTGSFVICPANGDEEQIHRIYWSKIVDNSYELYSKYLIEKLNEVNINWNPEGSYRILGRILPKQNIAVFNMADATLINSNPL